MNDVKPKFQPDRQDFSETGPTSEVEDMHIEGEKSISSMPVSLAPSKKKPNKGLKILLIVVLIIVAVFVVLLIVSKTTSWNILGVSKQAGVSSNGEKIAKASDWQAVFLTNGQVYFGKLKNANSNYPTLEDIYYLQVQKVPIQPAAPAANKEGVQPAQKAKQQLILVKFGTELHRPMDKMYINKDHIIFFEDLRADSGVVAAIEKYKEQQNAKAQKPKQKAANQGQATQPKNANQLPTTQPKK